MNTVTPISGIKSNSSEVQATTGPDPVAAIEQFNSLLQQKGSDKEGEPSDLLSELEDNPELTSQLLQLMVTDKEDKEQEGSNGQLDDDELATLLAQMGISGSMMNNMIISVMSAKKSTGDDEKDKNLMSLFAVIQNSTSLAGNGQGQLNALIADRQEGSAQNYAFQTSSPSSLAQQQASQSDPAQNQMLCYRLLSGPLTGLILQASLQTNQVMLRLFPQNSTQYSALKKVISLLEGAGLQDLPLDLQLMPGSSGSSPNND